jgi:hypothetical protein
MGAEYARSPPAGGLLRDGDNVATFPWVAASWLGIEWLMATLSTCLLA